MDYGKNLPKYMEKYFPVTIEWRQLIISGACDHVAGDYRKRIVFRRILKAFRFRRSRIIGLAYFQSIIYTIGGGVGFYFDGNINLYISA